MDAPRGWKDRFEPPRTLSASERFQNSADHPALRNRAIPEAQTAGAAPRDENPEPGTRNEEPGTTNEEPAPPWALKPLAPARSREKRAGGKPASRARRSSFVRLRSACRFRSRRSAR